MGRMTGVLKDKDFMYRYSRVIFAGGLLLALLVFASCINPLFLAPLNVRRLIYSAFGLMMVSYGQSMVLMTAGIDVSLGEIVSLCNVVCVTLMRPESPAGWVLAILAAMAVGFLCGALNGAIIAKFKLSPMIVTISMSIVYGGLALFVMPVPTGSMHQGLAGFMKANVGPIPMTLILILVILVLVRTLTNYTPFGKALRAVGGNENSAYSTGIPVFKIKVLTYGLSGLLASIGGIWLAVYINSGDPTIGTGISLNAVASSVIGGVSLAGATGDLIGTVFGVIIFSMISNLLNLNGVSTNYQFLIKGLILIAALAVSSVRQRRD